MVKKSIYGIRKKDPFWQEWQPERWKFSEFIETAPIEKVLELIIIAYKDKYPRNYWFGMFTKLEAHKHVREDNGYRFVDSEYLERKEFFKYSYKYLEDADGIKYLSEMIIELKEPFSDMISMVERTLSGKTYTKASRNGNTIYQLTDSPLLKLEVADKYFALTVNDTFHTDLGFG